MKKTAVAKKGVKKKVPRIKLDPVAEYRAIMAKDGAADVLRMADDDVWFHIRHFISTQSLALDRAIGYDGIPCGRITEITGDNHTGKSTILDHILAQTQLEGGWAILVDTEFGHDVRYARRIGIDPEKLLVVQPKQMTVEAVFRLLYRTIEHWEKYPDLPLTIGVDSIAGMPTEGDLKIAADDGRAQPGEAARSIHNMCRVLGAKVARREVALIFTNQLYNVIGGGFTYKRSYGGEALPYHASLRIKTRRGEPIRRSDGTIAGQICEVEILKSKINGRSGAKCQIGILHGVGVDNVWTIFDAFKREKYIAVLGAWHTMHLPGEDSPRRWQNGHFGLRELCSKDEQLMPRLVHVYNEIPNG